MKNIDTCAKYWLCNKSPPTVCVQLTDIFYIPFISTACGAVRFCCRENHLEHHACDNAIQLFVCCHWCSALEGKNLWPVVCHRAPYRTLDFSDVYMVHYSHFVDMRNKISWVLPKLVSTKRYQKCAGPDDNFARL